MSFQPSQSPQTCQATISRQRTGTTVTFWPDTSIFESTEFSFETLSQRLRELAFLNAGVTITLDDEREDGKSHRFHYDGGIVSFVEHLNKNKGVVNEKPLFMHGERDGIDETAWVDIDYTDGGVAQVAETTLAGRRLIVRRTRLVGAQAQLWPDWRHHAFITDLDGDAVAVDADHRAHAVVELAIRDLKAGAGRYANSYRSPNSRVTLC